MMRDRAKQLVLRGLEHTLRARGISEADLPLARKEVLEWAKVQARAGRGRRGIVGALGVV
ncbi:MAG: hypothetical protein H0W96_13705, partial [Solirubrobacterales bacterium]|nr:hypothetical protein [Solirubrobacterales bacterium]